MQSLWAKSQLESLVKHIFPPKKKEKKLKKDLSLFEYFFPIKGQIAKFILLPSLKGFRS